MKKNMIKGFIKKHPDLIFIFLMVIVIMINVTVAANHASMLDLWLVYVLGVMQLIPILAIIIYVIIERNKALQKKHDDQLKDKDRIISKQAHKIAADKDSVSWGEEASRLYAELKSRMAEQTAKFEKLLNHYKKREAIYEAVYVRDDFSQKLYKYVSFLWSYDELLDLFDPVAYLTDKYYNTWVNTNVRKWNELIEDNQNNERMCLIRLRNEVESTKPKKTTSDASVPELERSSKKLSHITNDREDR